MKGGRVVLRPVVAAVATLIGLYWLLIRRWILRWGSTPDERQRALPGDALAPDAGYVTTRAVTIEAPAQAVWPWLVQMGQDRGGFYTHNWVERLLRSGIPDVHELHPEWQRLEVGDLVRTNHDIGGQPMGWPVAAIEHGRSIVVRSKSLPAGTYAFIGAADRRQPDSPDRPRSRGLEAERGPVRRSRLRAPPRLHGDGSHPRHQAAGRVVCRRSRGRLTIRHLPGGSGDRHPLGVLMVPLRYGEEVVQYVAVLELAAGLIRRATGYWARRSRRGRRERRTWTEPDPSTGCATGPRAGAFSSQSDDSRPTAPGSMSAFRGVALHDGRSDPRSNCGATGTRRLTLRRPMRRPVLIAIAMVAIVSSLVACTASGGTSALTGKTWQLTAVTEKTPAFQGVIPAADQPRYTVEFNTDGTYSGQADCNAISGKYTTSGTNVIAIQAGASTLMMCADPESFGSIYAHALTTATTWAVANNELTLGNAAGRDAPVRRRHRRGLAERGGRIGRTRSVAVRGRPRRRRRGNCPASRRPSRRSRAPSRPRSSRTTRSRSPRTGRSAPRPIATRSRARTGRCVECARRSCSARRPWRCARKARSATCSC